MRKKGLTIEKQVLDYFGKVKTASTFKELYSALNNCSPQGIRNAVYRLERRGVVEKIEGETVSWGKKRVIFKLKK